MSILGWIGSIILSLCALPQCLQCIKNKNSEGLNLSFLALWWLGCFSLFIAMLDSGKYFLLLNYLANMIMIIPMIYYKIKPQNIDFNKK